MAVTKEQVNQLYGQLLGRQGQDQYLQGWVDSGMTLDEIAAASQTPRKVWHMLNHRARKLHPLVEMAAVQLLAEQPLVGRQILFQTR